MRSGGIFHTQCGGKGNLAQAKGIADKVRELPEYETYFRTWEYPTNYAGASGGNLSVHQAIVRVDQYFSPHDQVFAHYIYAHRDFPVRDLNPNFTFTGNYPIHNFQAQYVHVFSPTFINELRGGFDFENVAVFAVANLCDCRRLNRLPRDARNDMIRCR